MGRAKPWLSRGVSSRASLYRGSCNHKAEPASWERWGVGLHSPQHSAETQDKELSQSHEGTKSTQEWNPGSE